VLDLAGIDPGRIRFVEPAPGPSGPRESLNAFRRSLGALGRLALGAAPSSAMPALEGLDAAIELGERLAQGAGRAHGGASWLGERSLPALTAGKPALLVGDLPWLDVATESLLAPTRLGDAASFGLRVLAALGIRDVGVALSTERAGAATWSEAYALEPAVAAARGAMLIDELVRQRGSTLPRRASRTKVAIDGSAAAEQLVAALGFEAVSVGPDPLPDRFAFSSAERALAAERLRLGERGGAVVLLVSGPRALGRWALLVRHGVWQSSHLIPVLGVHLGALAIGALKLGRSSLLARAARAAQAREVAP